MDLYLYQVSATFVMGFDHYIYDMWKRYVFLHTLHSYYIVAYKAGRYAAHLPSESIGQQTPDPPNYMAGRIYSKLKGLTEISLQQRLLNYGNNSYSAVYTNLAAS